MFIYYSFWFLISLIALPFKKGKYHKILVYIIYLSLIIFVGLRFKIGGDWRSYQDKLINYQYVESIEGFLSLSEPGYGLLNLLSLHFNINDIFFVNTICSVLFFLCLYKFSKRLDDYLFPIFVCFAYTIVVVATGYTRQTVAIGFSLLAFISVLDRKLLNFIFYVFLGSLFHKTILFFIIFVPLFFNFFNLRNSLILFIYTFFSFSLISFVVYLSIKNEYNAYTTDLSSKGVYMRLLMHVVPVFCYLYYRKIFVSYLGLKVNIIDFSTYIIIYLFFLAMFLSTLTDRMNLYFVYYDIFILSFLFNKLSINTKMILWFSIFFTNSVVLSLWLFFGKWTAVSWLPYNNYIFVLFNGLF